jgi:tRNA(Ile)-lysidine synthase
MHHVEPFEAVQTLPRDLQFTVALSGGADSVAALVAFSHLQLNVRALHVQHGDDLARRQMADFCSKLCNARGVPFDVVQITVPDQGNWESQARKLRYQALADAARDRTLVTGHHLDDQVETFFLKALRGSGLRGLKCMETFGTNPENATQPLVRPFLHLSKSKLEQFLMEQGVEWVQDPTNTNTDLNRNFLRMDILPQIEMRWPNYRASIASTIQALQSDWAALMHSLPPHAISLGQARTWTAEQLRAWVMNCFATHGSGKCPSAQQVAEFVRQIQSDPVRNNAKYEISCGGFCIRRNRNTLELEIKS